jgi:membrane-associated phospholipid phosphatase
VRISEQFLMAYFAYVAIAGTIFHVGIKPWLLLAAVTILILILSRTNGLLRDFAPLAFTLMAYREMNLFAGSPHDGHLEHAWIVWDRWLLDDLHLRALIEFSGFLIPSYLELCYLLVYSVAPVSLAILFANRHRESIDRFWLIYLVGTLGAYALFPYFPSEPPRAVFAGLDMPHITTAIRRFNLWIVGGYGIHSSVFPSAHVSSALSAAWAFLALIPERRWIGKLMTIYGISVAIATIYGRYHFATDAAGGIAISLVAALVASTQANPRTKLISI